MPGMLLLATCCVYLQLLRMPSEPPAAACVAGFGAPKPGGTQKVVAADQRSNGKPEPEQKGEGLNWQQGRL